MPADDPSSNYYEISVSIPGNCQEMYSDFVIEEIAFGLLTEDIDDKVKVTCYIAMDNSPLEKIAKIRHYLTLRKIIPESELDGKIQIKKIRDIDWISHYQKEFKAVVLEDLVIKTPWDKNDYSGKKIITIEPKMAFGTGKHETTQLCLQAIKKEVKPGMKILDLGTGSGILSIYAAILGADELLGLDIDPDAVQNAIENARVNNVGGRFNARHGSIEQVRTSRYYDMVISNLIKEGIIELFDDFMRVLKPGGIIILSGILDEQKTEMTAYFEERISADIEIIQLNEWLCYILRTK